MTTSSTSWASRTAYVVGGGPSLKGYDLSTLRASGFVVGVNRAADLVPVDATVSIDRDFCTRRRADLQAWARSHEVYIAAEPESDIPEIPGTIRLLRERKPGLSLSPGCLHSNYDSGYAALNLAVLKGARRIVLLGFDLNKPPEGRGRHWHDGYPWAAIGTTNNYARWAKHYETVPDSLPDGVVVLNANSASAIRCFPFTNYEEEGLVRGHFSL